MTCVLHFGIQLIQVLVFVVIAVSSSCEPHKEGLQTKSNHKFQVLREMYNLALQTFAYGQTLQLRAVARADGKTLFADDTPRVLMIKYRFLFYQVLIFKHCFK